MHNQTVCGMGSISVYYVINVYDSYKYTSEPFYIKLWDWSSKSLAHARFRARSTGCVAPAVTRGLLCSGWRRWGFPLSFDAHRVPETVTLSCLSSHWGQGSLWRAQFTWPVCRWAVLVPGGALQEPVSVHGSKVRLGEQLRHRHVWSDSVHLVRWIPKGWFSCPINMPMSQHCYASVLV